MAVIWSIAKTELRAYFDSAIAYVCIGAFLGGSALVFYTILFLQGQVSMRALFMPSLISPSALLALLIPILTIRLVAEEKRTGTIELLTTFPIRDSEVVLGKFLGALGLILAALLMTLAFTFTVATLGHLDWGPVFTGYLGLILFATALTALGVMCSTLSESQIVAAVIGVFLALGLYFVDFLHVLLPSGLGSFVQTISISHHLSDLSRGVIDTRDVLYYLSVTAIALLLAERSLARSHA